MIRINDKYYVKADEKNFILCEKSTIQKEDSKNFGAETETILGFFGSLEHAIQYLVKDYGRKIVSEKDYTLKQALDDIKQYNDELIKAIRGED